jgi:hypothetical protein
MSTRKPKSPLIDAFSALPPDFRSRLAKTYSELKTRHREGKHESAGLSAGKLSETVLRLLQNDLTGSHTPFGQPLPNFISECERLSHLPKTAGVESLRVVIPRALAFLYTLRSKRGIGHVGGDVDANAIDGATVARLADWIVCELIRVFHKLSLEEAESLVASISSRDLPDIWEVAGKKRVLRSDLDFKQKTLLLLYSSVEAAVLAEDLFLWAKYSDLSMYKHNVLRPMDHANLVEYDTDTQSVIISPLGVKQVEEQILAGPRV